MHTRHSESGHLRRPAIRAGLGVPHDLYRVAKARGMDLVTFTDLDTIEGCLEFLERHPEAPDFFTSEEVRARDPRTGREHAVLVFDLDAARHREIAALRADIRDLAAYLRAEGLPAAFAPGLGGGEPGRAGCAPGDGVRELFAAVEVLSGIRPRRHNDLEARLVQRRRIGRAVGAVGGSCAHGPGRVGTTWTASHASSRAGFLSDLRAGRTWAGGASGGSAALARDLVGSLAQECRRRPAAILRLPFDLLHAPIRHGWGRARSEARVRRAGRRLDREDLTAFQQKAKSYVLVPPAAGRGAGGAS